MEIGMGYSYWVVEGKIMNLLFLDFETYYSTQNKYDLKSISMTEYIRSDKFKVHGLGWKEFGDKQKWVSGKDVKTFISRNFKDTTIISHNVKFDGAILAWRYGIKPKQYIDTVAMARAILGIRIRDYSLRTLAEYFNLPAKEQLKTDNLEELTIDQEKELSEYCLHDVWLCEEIFKRLEPSFPKSEYFHIDWTSRAFIEPKLVLNVSLLEKAAKEEAKRRETIFEQIGINKEIFSSNKKFPELLASKGYEIPIKLSPSTGKLIPALALGDPEFLTMRETENKELNDLIEARIAAKSTLLETRAGKLVAIGKTGLFPFDVQYSGAVQTHRYSGGNGAAGNPQNFPKKGPLREAIEAPEGYKLIVADFDKIELRITAWLANETILKQQIIDGGDVYSDFASKIYKRQITKNDTKERFFGKTCMLGLQYGMGADRLKKTVKLQTGLNITEEFAEKTIKLYRTYYNRIPSLWKYLDATIGATSRGIENFVYRFLKGGKDYILLPSKLRLNYPNLKREDKKWVYTGFKNHRSIPKDITIWGGKLLENISQALAGEICKDTIKRLTEANLNVVGQVHDEVLIVSKNQDIQHDSILVSKIMTTPPVWWPDLKLKAEIGVGKNWFEAKNSNYVVNLSQSEIRGVYAPAINN